MIHVSHSKDFIDHRSAGKAEALPFEGKTLAQLAAPDSVVARINGITVAKGSPDWDSIPPDGSRIRFVEADGSGRNGQLILAWAQIGLGVLLAIIPGFQAVGIGLIVGGIATATRALMTPSAVGLDPTSGFRDKSSPAYGFDGIPNTVANGTPIPVVYGEHKVGGQYIYAETIRTSAKNETLRLLIAVSHGPVESIGGYDSAACLAAGGDTNGVDGLTGDDLPEGLQINGMDAKTLRGVTCSIRLGAASQTRVPGFINTVQQYDQQNLALDGDSRFGWETRSMVNAVEANLVFPAGLYQTSKTGKIKSKSIIVQMDVYNRDRATLVSSTTKTIKAKDTQPVYASIAIAGLATDRYYVETYRTAPIPPAYQVAQKGKRKEDRCYLSAFKETSYGAPSYAGLALLAVIVPATNQMSGRIQRVNVMMKGRTVQTSDGSVWSGTETWSDNAAWCAADALTHPDYGAGAAYSYAKLPAAEWKAWADYNEEVINAWTSAAASYGAVEERPGNGSSAAIDPAITGTYVGAVTGYAEIELLSLVTDTSATFRFTLYPNDGTTPSSGDFTFASTTPQVIGSGLSLAPALDPNTSTAGWTVGDLWTFPLQAAVTERRFVFNRIFDSDGPAFEQAVSIAATTRTSLVDTGVSVLPFQEKPRETTGPMLTRGSIVAGSEQVQFVSPSSRYNSVLVQYLDASKNYTQQAVIASLPGLSEGDSNIRQQSIQLWGCTAATEANRHAHYMLRGAQANIELLSIETGAEGIGMLPLETFYYASDTPSWGASGRVLGTSGGNVQLDQTFAFVTGKTYIYYERRMTDDAQLSQLFVATTTTDVLPFAPLYAGDPTGRTFFVCERFTEQIYMALALAQTKGGFGRSIQAVRYEASIYTDDAEPLEDAQFIAEPGAAPNPATNLAVVETSTVAGTSTIALTWTAAAGASYYEVWVKEGEDEGFNYVGETTGTELVFNTDARQGTPLTIRVITVQDDGQRTALASAPELVYYIRREERTSVLALFPADVANLALAVSSGNTYTLSWDAVALDTNGAAMTPTGYEVRIGNFISGALVYRGAATSITVELDPLQHYFNVRAYKTAGGGRDYYSAGNTRVLSSAVNVTGYTVQPTDALTSLPAAITVGEPDTLSNGLWAPWYESPTTKAAMQIIEGFDLELLSESVDLSTSAATQVSIDCKTLPYISDEIDGFGYFGSMLNESFFGEINREYVEWTLFVEHSTDGATWLQENYKDHVAANDTAEEIILTARYFRLRFSGKGINPYDGDADYPDETDAPARLLLTRLAALFYRA